MSESAANQLELEFRSHRGGRSQCDRILSYLQTCRGQWVPMPALWRASGAFAVHSRISDLRAAGHVIQHTNDRAEDGTVLSRYRLL